MLLLVLAYYYDKLEQVSLSYYESKIESKIHTYEKEIIDIFQDEEFIKRAIVFDFEESELDELGSFQGTITLFLSIKNQIP